MKVNWSGVLALIGALCMHSVLGSLYLWGAMSPYVTSYYHSLDKNATASFLLWFEAIRAGTMFFMLPYGSYVERNYGPTIVTTITYLAWVPPVLCFVFVENYILFMVILGFSWGIATGFGYVAPIPVLWRHFPNHKGLISGIILAAYGFGPAILTPIVQLICNPNDVSPSIISTDGEETLKFYDYEVPKMWAILGIVWSTLLLVSILLLKNPSKYEHNELIDRKAKNKTLIDIFRDREVASSLAYTVSFVDSRKPAGQSLIGKPKDMSLIEDDVPCPNVSIALKSSQMWLLTTMLALSVFLDYFLALTYKDIGQNNNYSDSFLSIVGSVYTVFNGLSRIFWGWLSDHMRFKPLYAIIITGMVLCCALLPILGSRHEVFFLIFVDGTSLFTPGNFSVFPSLSMRVFGSL